MGVGGTAMAALAGMLVDAGHTVTGSDANRVYPPMSDYLTSIGVTPMFGYAAANLDHRPDLVVVGNVVRAAYPEAEALLAGDLPYMSFPALLGARFLADRRSIVVAGTHGKTTTTALTAWLLEAAGLAPGFLVGGVPANFDRTARAARGPHFVVEGDEYDTAFFDKGPKFLHYRPQTVILTSIEFDHADIYRDLAHCQEAFRRLMALMPPDGLVVARWDHDTVAEVAREAGCAVRRYGPGQDWDGKIEAVDTDAGRMTFSVWKEGRLWGRFESGLVGEHNLYNQVAAAAALDHEGVGPEALGPGFAGFRGIKRRQEIIGEPRGVTVVDDFAHHPTAVRVTLEALRLRFGGRRLWAIFEARSNTSRRRTFQREYGEAFDAADLVLLAPPQGLESVPEAERFSPEEVARDVLARGGEARVIGAGADPEGVADAICAHVKANAQAGDVVAILSNGGFGGLHRRLLAALGEAV
jgi:UDP-N-acetylmuramate: L-alanyl-gamma-D-glutamyl-meso-diaminopimelate ligase